MAELAACEPAALLAVTVQVPVPAALVPTAMLPLKPEPEPDAAPEQATEADVALLVDQLKVELLPAVTEVGENEALAEGAATTDRLAEPDAPVPSALAADTVQVPVPVPEVATASEPEVPLLVPDAVPEHETEALVALAVVQLKVLAPPEVTVAGENDMPVMAAGA